MNLAVLKCFPVRFAPTVLRINGLTQPLHLATIRPETFFPWFSVVIPANDNVLDRIIGFMDDNRYGRNNSLWIKHPSVIDAVVTRVDNYGPSAVNTLHTDFAPWLSTRRRTGLVCGLSGELTDLLLRTLHIQDISFAADVQPGTAVLVSTAEGSRW
jgi:hypothetical protein